MSHRLTAFRGTSFRARASIRKSRRLFFEPLEARALLATLTVNSIADTDDGTCDAAQCTLREALTASNASVGTRDSIVFNIPGSGVHTIAVGSTGLSVLPPITDPVDIDGYTQPGASPNSLAGSDNAALLIELNGTQADRALRLNTNASGSTIKGLVINRFKKQGILVVTSGGAKIAGCFIGTDATGTMAMPNGTDATPTDSLALGAGWGVDIFNTKNVLVGGLDPADRNIISGNTRAGIRISGSDVLTQAFVAGNFIGTGAGGQPLGNGTTGSIGPAGVLIAGGVDGNVIGAIVGLLGAPNVIAFNKGDGVLVASGDQNTILGNSIYGNDGLAINLIPNGALVTTGSPTPNDGADDTDTGGNGLMNFPVGLKSSYDVTKNETIISGVLSAPNPATAYVELFDNDNADPSGYGEGQRSLGVVIPEANGKFRLELSGRKSLMALTATATDAQGNTSEFSSAYSQPVALSLNGFFAGRTMTINSTTGDASTGQFAWQLVNTSIRSATGVSVSIPVPEQLADIFNLNAEPAGTFNYDAPTRLLTFAFPDLQPGQTQKFGFTAKPAAIGPVSVTAAVSVNEPLVGGGLPSKTITELVQSDLTNFHLYNPDPSITPKPRQGPVITDADLVPIYYGSQWLQPANSAFPAQMHAAMQSIVTGPYMDFLKQYSTSSQKIGRGRIQEDQYQTSNAAPGLLEDRGYSSSTSQIKSIIKAQIDSTVANSGLLPSPVTLYVLYTPPNCIIKNDSVGGDSTKKFFAYHDVVPYTFNARTYQFYYIVMPYETSPNVSYDFPTTTFDGMTSTFSHELAEAVTDPDVVTGWRDYKARGQPEIGDIPASQLLQQIEPEGRLDDYGMLDGYAVQYEWANKYTYPGTNFTVKDQPVLPRGLASKTLSVTKIVSPFKPAPGGASVTATVGAADAGFSFSGLVATFTDTSHPGTDPTIYTPTIDWHDGTTSAGTVAYDPNLKQFLISGSHNFAAAAGSTAAIIVSLINNENGDIASFSADVTLDQATAAKAPVQFDQPTFEAYRNGSDAVITVSRVGDATLGATVDFHVSGGTAVDGTDFQAEAGTLEFAKGATSATILLPIYANPAATGDLTVNLALSTPTGNTKLGTQATTVLTIHPSEDIFTPASPLLAPESDTGAAIDDAITADNGSAASPLIFEVSGASVPNGFVQLVDVTDPNHPIALGAPVQASQGAATITLSGTALSDGVHQFAIANSVSADSTPSNPSPALQVVLDRIAPTSALSGLPARTSLTSLPITWSGADNATGVGLQGFNISVSVDGATAIPWLEETNLTSANYDAALGHSYAFFLSAIDIAGNAESAHATADATVVVTATPWKNPRDPLDVNDDTHISAADPLDVINYINGFGPGLLPASAPKGQAYLDVSGDNSIAPGDALDIINHINAFGSSEGEGPAPATDIADIHSTQDGITDLLCLLAFDGATQSSRRRR